MSTHVDLRKMGWEVAYDPMLPNFAKGDLELYVMTYNYGRQVCIVHFRKKHLIRFTVDDMFERILDIIERKTEIV